MGFLSLRVENWRKGPGRRPPGNAPTSGQTDPVFGIGAGNRYLPAFLKMVSAAGVAPAITPSQAEHVAATLRAVCPGRSGGHRGLGFVETAASIPWNHVPSKFWRTRRDLHPQPSRRQRVALLIELRIRNGGKCWYCPNSSFPALFNDTGFTVQRLDHFPKVVAGVGVAPT